jgi:hypothetical protein
VNVKRLESCGRAFDDGLFSFDKVQNVHTAGHIVFHQRIKPVPSSLDDFQFVQSGSFFDPARALANLLDTLLLRSITSA